MDEANAAYSLGWAVGGIVGCVAAVAIPALFVGSLIAAFVKKSRLWAVIAGIAGVLLLGLVGVAVVFGVIGAREAARANAAAEPGAGSSAGIVATSEGRAVLDIPDDWQQLDLDNADAALQVGNLRREEYLIVIAEPISDFDLDLAGFAELASGLTVGAVEGGEILGAPRSLEINGFPARRVEIAGTSEGLRVRYHATYVEGADHYYQVLAWTLPSRRGVAFPRFDRVVATFRER